MLMLMRKKTSRLEEDIKKLNKTVFKYGFDGERGGPRMFPRLRGLTREGHEVPLSLAEDFPLLHLGEAGREPALSVTNLRSDLCIVRVIFTL